MKSLVLSGLMTIAALTSTAASASSDGSHWPLPDGTDLWLRFKGSVDVMDVQGAQLYTFVEYNNENRVVRRFTQLGRIRGELVAYPYPGSMTFRGTLTVRVAYGDDGSRTCDLPLEVTSLYWTQGSPVQAVVDYRLPIPTGYYSSRCKPKNIEDRRAVVDLD